jgi:hypothetical protein
MKYFSGYILLISDTLSEVSPILPFGLADTLGSMHWRWLRVQLLPRCGTDPSSETKLAVWESTDLPFKAPDIPVVANTRWLGSMAGRWLGGPMAAVGPVVEKADKVRSAR